MARNKGAATAGNTGGGRVGRQIPKKSLTGNFVINAGAELMMGSPLTSALGRGAAFTAWELVSPWSFGAYVGGSMLAAAGGALNSAAKNTAKDLETTRYNPNAYFQNNMGYNPANQQIATMRQASVQAIQGSKLNARNALGNEASLMHRAYY